ncbi:Proteasome assembly chaperone 2 [Cichlidogyrus casuarinus]|uniref:Proteasome assembly chaperone 2 n=1 Tax=Cichlidogyrus casuarinus TaxID=1844966 RepID=A0ABD2QAT7_9PLAT
MLKSSDQITNLSDFILVVSGFGRSSLGQMASDLLIFNMKLKKQSSIYLSSLPPLVGINPYGESDQLHLATNCQLFADPTKKLAVLLIRSRPNNNKKFIEQLSTEIHQLKPAKVIILCDSFVSNRRPTSEVNGLFHHSLAPINSDSKDKLLQIGAREFESLTAEQLGLEAETGSNLSLPNTGPTKGLFLNLSKLDLSVLLLIYYPSGGSTLRPLFDFTSAIAKFLSLEPNEWKTPPSFDYLVAHKVNPQLY